MPGMGEIFDQSARFFFPVSKTHIYRWYKRYPGKRFFGYFEIFTTN